MSQDGSISGSIWGVRWGMDSASRRKGKEVEIRAAVMYTGKKTINGEEKNYKTKRHSQPLD
jgi:hypothetical protein